MSHKKYKDKSYCPGGRLYSGTISKSMYDDTSKTGRNWIIGEFVNSKKKESIFVSNNTTPAEKLYNFIKTYGGSFAEVGKN